MSDYDFSQIEAILIDPQLTSMRVIRDVLIRIGIKKITIVPLAEIKTRLADIGAADLLIADADNADSETIKLVRLLRNEPGVANPFICSIITTWQPTTSLLTRVTNSGADDLLVKPASPKQIMDRIVALVENRKKFVITSDFTGPDRRRSPRGPGQIPVLDPPNTLRLKATGQFSKTSARDLIGFGIAKVNEMKLVRGSIQAAFLIEFARPGLAKAPPDRLALDHLGRVPAVVEEMRRRFTPAEIERGHAECGKSLAVLAAAIRSRPGDDAVEETDLDRLRHLARQQMREIMTERSEESLIREVEEAVNGYRNKLAELLAAKQAEVNGRSEDSA